MAQSPHDALVKHAFGDTENAAAELRAVLPQAIVEALDFRTLRVCPGSYVDDALRDLHSDLLYEVQLAGREALLYVLFEHQSRVDPLMPYRLLRYVVRVWEAWRREHPNARKLPAVLPVVLHHGRPLWTGPVRLDDLIDLEPELLEVVQKHVPRMELLLDDLGAQSEEALYRRAMSAYGRLVLWSLRSAGGRPAPETLELWGKAFSEAATAPNGRAAVVTVLRYLVQVLGDDARGIIDVLVEGADDRAVGEEYVTLYESILREGMQKGLEQGIQQGLEKGREALRTIVLKQVAQKLGPPSDVVRQRIAEAGPDELEAVATRILTAASFDDLFD